MHSNVQKACAVTDIYEKIEFSDIHPATHAEASALMQSLKRPTYVSVACAARGGALVHTIMAPAARKCRH